MLKIRLKFGYIKTYILSLHQLNKKYKIMTTYKLFPEHIEMTSDVTDVIFNSDQDLMFILQMLATDFLLLSVKVRSLVRKKRYQNVYDMLTSITKMCRYNIVSTDNVLSLVRGILRFVVEGNYKDFQIFIYNY